MSCVSDNLRLNKMLSVLGLLVLLWFYVARTCCERVEASLVLKRCLAVMFLFSVSVPIYVSLLKSNCE